MTDQQNSQFSESVSTDDGSVHLKPPSVLECITRVILELTQESIAKVLSTDGSNHLAHWTERGIHTLTEPQELQPIRQTGRKHMKPFNWTLALRLPGAADRTLSISLERETSEPRRTHFNWAYRQTGQSASKSATHFSISTFKASQARNGPKWIVYPTESEAPRMRLRTAE